MSEKRVLPMQKVINHMKAKEYRPVETFRLLDIEVNKTLTHEEIVSRMKVALFIIDTMCDTLNYFDTWNSKLPQNFKLSKIHSHST